MFKCSQSASDWTLSLRCWNFVPLEVTLAKCFQSPSSCTTGRAACQQHAESSVSWHKRCYQREFCLFCKTWGLAFDQGNKQNLLANLSSYSVNTFPSSTCESLYFFIKLHASAPAVLFSLLQWFSFLPTSLLHYCLPSFPFLLCNISSYTINVLFSLYFIDSS